MTHISDEQRIQFAYNLGRRDLQEGHTCGAPIRPFNGDEYAAYVSGYEAAKRQAKRGDPPPEPHIGYTKA